MRVFAGIILTATICAGACSYPDTDITANNTERVGDYDIVHTRGGESLDVDVCVAQPSRVDDVAARLLHQLRNHGYRAITLNMYGQDGPIARVEWKDAQTRRYGLNTNTNAVSCAPKTGANETR